MKRLVVLLSLFFCLLEAPALWAQLNPLTMTVTKSDDGKDDKKESIDATVLTEEQKEKLRSPQQTMRTFIEAMEKVKLGQTSYFDQAIMTIDLSEINQGLRQVTGKITAERLINTIDRIAKINFDHVPPDTDGPKWFYRKQTVTVGDKNYDVEIALAKTNEGVWKFTPETVSSIENFYSSVAQLRVVEGVTEYRNWRTHIKDRMPAWTAEEFLSLKKGQWLGLLVLISLALTTLTLVRFMTTIYLRYKVNQKFLDFSTSDQFKSTLPFGLLGFSITWLVGIRFLEFDINTFEFFSRASYIMTAFFMVWSALKLVDYISLHFEKMAENTANKFDDVLVPMLKKASKVLVVSFGTILVAHSLTFDVASILAGLGIGGVAIALAAKDTISNLFGSVTVLMDRPFQIGDFIILEKGVDGVVEQVGFRSTRIRTPSNSLITMPNSVLANMAIDNYGMRKIRRYRTIIQLDHSATVDKVEEFCERIKYLVQLNPLIQKDNALIFIFDMNSNSIDVLVNIFFITEDYKVELGERHKFISDLLKLALEMKIQFAYPSHRVLLGNKAEELPQNL